MQVTVQHVDGMRFLATEDGHTVVVDAAPEHGGGGTAMSAPQLFVAALGACILEFVVNSCRLRGVPVERLSVEMDCDEVPGPRRVGAVSAAVSLDPEPPADVKRRVIGVARHATLINTLVQPPEVDIHLAGQGEEESGAA
jgi:organic hydroperoxide reductase OsmC/OhrA